MLAEPGRPATAFAAAISLTAVGLLIITSLPAGIPVAGLMAAGIVALSAWMLITPRYGLTLAALMLYVGLVDGYLKLKTGSDYLTIARDVLLYAIAAGAIIRATVGRERISLPPLTGWVVAWLVVVGIQVFNPANGTFLHSVAAVRPHVEWVPLFFFGYLLMQDKRSLKVFLGLFVLIAAINGVVGLAQFNMTPEQLASWGPGYEQKVLSQEDVAGRAFVDDEGTLRTRPFALGSDQGFGGILGLMAVPAILALLAIAARPPVRAAVLLLAAGCVLGIVTSQARVAVVGAVVAALAFAALTVTSRAGFRTVMAVGLAGLLAYGTVTILEGDSDPGSFDRYGSIATPADAVATAYDYRSDTIALVPEYVADFPLGAGIGSKGPGASFTGSGTGGKGLNAESEPTYLVIELGIPGLFVLLGLNLKLFALSIGRIRRVADRDLRVLLTAIAAPLFALFATWLVGVSSATTPSAPYFWFAAGVLAYWLAGDGWRTAGGGSDVATPQRRAVAPGS